MNVLAVSHQQDISHGSVSVSSHVTSPTLVTSLDLTSLDTERSTVTVSLPVIKTGTANGLLYWWIQHWGWNLTLDTKESQAFSQAAFLCKETQVGFIGIAYLVNFIEFYSN